MFYTGIDSHPGLTHYGLYDTVVARELGAELVHDLGGSGSWRDTGGSVRPL